MCDAEAVDGPMPGFSPAPATADRRDPVLDRMPPLRTRRLHLADYRPGDRSLKVCGKGDKERRVYLIPDAVGRLERWIAVRGGTPPVPI
ncbi:hypothetical protein [Sphaerimonospora mesophila]|uniref:hypothetical protein n=1 Tax=Sphaerimonospora mesophila TaxID=37483 RepID=UPI0006E33605